MRLHHGGPQDAKPKAEVVAKMLASIKDRRVLSFSPMNLKFLAILPASKPAVAGLVIAALVGLYLAFKISKFIIKLVLVLAALAAIGLTAWWYFTTHHGMP